MLRIGRLCLLALLPGLLPVAVRAAHPLITEDTGTQGTGRYQFELTNEHTAARDSGVRQYTVLTNGILSYGVTDAVDVLVSAPYLRLGAASDGSSAGAVGPADAGLDLKWRFFERGPLSIALKPGLTFPTGDDTRGLGVGERTWSAYVVTSYDQPPWTFHLHLGHLHHNNTLNERVDLWHASAAVVRQAGTRLKLILDTGLDTNTDRAFDDSPLFVIVGAIWSASPDFDIDLGFRRQHDGSSDARSWLAGLTWRW